MIAIIDYDAGNLTSVARALTHLGYKNEITAAAETILAADRVIFPGVGAAKATMQTLQKRGLNQVLTDFYHTGRPMLGICIGIQILFEHSEEEDAKCLGLLPGYVQKYPQTYPMIDTENKTETLKVPQIGWNEVHQTRSHRIFENVPNPAHFYFVNSYYPVPAAEDIVIGKTEYGLEFCSAIAHDNLIATQFHLEKSGRVGLKMLNNFLKF
ncbi:imidazole glycerol phosphate synthase subunit HisH [Candidatus Poribacteria bacterium]|nr:imidazole glycerol phosphate synthase subunit HisH [Candidatus Poribacteria bacterium]MYH80998.1 imidazole glycerol phosphate synthase subunit HisH [Candidatus Poribacteria bacterium]MYK95737.1 imidazole glycerol phosphate synthase subunit HisH [Candidatus Poribacteria bacterium]